MKTLIVICIILSVLIVICLAFLGILDHNYFPSKNVKFRIKEIKKGKLTYYQSQVYRRFLGWGGFFTGKSTGVILSSDGMDSNKLDAEENIRVYKLLKNID